MTSTPIIDSHMHLWNPTHLNYAWLDEVPPIKSPFLPDDYRMAHGDHDVQAMVFVQCDCDRSQNVEEANWVASLAAGEPRIKGVVAFAPLEEGGAADVQLSQLQQIPLVKGIRRLIQSEDDPTFCIQPGFVQGVQALAKYDWPFDICIMHHQLESTIQLVRQCPNVRFVLDHVGKPGIKAGLVEPWKGHINELAGMENVHCKISGMVTEADHHAWTAEQLKPYVDHIIEQFGTHRIMFGGDWPVVTLACPLAKWIDTISELMSQLSADERRRYFHDNAAAFYGLNR